MGCAHRCTFCFVRAFEALAERPSDGRYGTSIRVKIEPRRGPSSRARPAVVAARAGRRRHGHRPIPAGRGPVPADARRDRGPRRRPDAHRADHPRAADRARHRRPVGRRGADRGRCHVLDPDPRPRDLATDRARHRAAGPAPARAPYAGGRRARRERRDGPDPARAVGRSGQDGRRRPGRARRRRDLGLDQRAVPAAGHPRALPGQPGPRLARPPADVRAAVRRPRLRQRRTLSSPFGSAYATWPGSTASPIGGGGRSSRRPPISSPASSSRWRSRTDSGSG